MWLDAVKKATAKMVYVLIEDTSGEPLRSTRVLKTSVAQLHSGQPTSRFEAMLRQLPALERDIDKICKKIAKCKVNGDSSLMNYFGKKVNDELTYLFSIGNTDWTEIRFGTDAAQDTRARQAAERAQRAEARARQAEERTRRMEEEAAAARATAAEAREQATAHSTERANFESQMNRMAEQLASLQAEFARERQRAQEAEERAESAERENEFRNQASLQDLLDDGEVDLQMN